MTKGNIENSVLKGIRYLQDHQYPNGEFCCYIGQDDEMKMCITQSNIFPTSLISYSILHLRHIPEASEILDKACAFLQYQAMRGGVWNNFTILNPLFRICPPDVDNTVCASLVLQKLDKHHHPNKELILANCNETGLFYTWFTLRPKFNRMKNYWLLILREFKHPIGTFLFWKNTEATRYDVDAAVNANILYYLGLNEQTAPIVDYMLDIIAKKKENDCDSWYCNPFTIYYFFSRNYKAGIQELEPAAKTIVERILATLKNDHSIGESILDTALGVISLINCGYHSILLEKTIEYIIDQQKHSGGWHRWAVYYGGPKKRLTYGSEEMTTGFCLEALALYNLQLQEGNINHSDYLELT
ncbi:hypothetical protein FBD94_17125 [Pedobacter hiemivivus]|uniref:Prenyltransferase n=1 Tax=Pedobacter hiemivivus TaxID=2530454 RepID=A0A4U1G9B1_9SPHI|nr:hypothetical protein [Pedobacter hiemivivus]TKC59253.1 hypothetical protein FBD94_17125 [Pedobacter hiemivivus]